MDARGPIVLLWAIRAVVLTVGEEDPDVLAGVRGLGADTVVTTARPSLAASAGARVAGLRYLPFLSTRDVDNLLWDQSALDALRAIPGIAGFHYRDEDVVEGYTPAAEQQRAHAILKALFPDALVLYATRLDLVATDPAYLERYFRPEFSDFVVPYFYPVGTTILGDERENDPWEDRLASLLAPLSERMPPGKGVLPVLQAFEQIGYPVGPAFAQRQFDVYRRIWPGTRDVAAFWWGEGDEGPLVGLAYRPGLQSSFRRFFAGLLPRPGTRVVPGRPIAASELFGGRRPFPHQESLPRPRGVQGAPEVLAEDSEREKLDPREERESDHQRSPALNRLALEELVGDQKDGVGESGERQNRARDRHPAQWRVRKGDDGVEEVLELLRERPAGPALLPRGAIVGNEGGRESAPENEARKRRVDLSRIDQEIDRGPPDQEAVEPSRRHLGEGEASQHPVVEAGGGARREAFRAAAPHGEDGGRPAAPGGDHFRKKLGRFLEVGRENRHGFSLRFAQAGHDRHLRAEVAGQPEAPRGRPVPGDGLDSQPRCVVGAVVHEENFEVVVRRLRDLLQPLGHARQTLRVAIDRDDDRDELALHRGPSKKSSTAAITASTWSSERPG